MTYQSIKDIFFFLKVCIKCGWSSYLKKSFKISMLVNTLKYL